MNLLANKDDVAPAHNPGQPTFGLASAISTSQSPLEREITLFANYMVRKGEEVCNATDPLEFWGNEGSVAFPILAGIAALF